MRIAVAGNEGSEVRVHFGAAGAFRIFELEGGELRLVDCRRVSPYTEGRAHGHAFDPERFAEVADALADCARVVCARIGEAPAEALRARGIEPVVHTGTLAELAAPAA